MIQLLTKIFLFVLFLYFSLISQAFAQDVTAQNGMVASAHPLATKVGLEILKQGGNAVDAGIATAMTLAVVEPNASGLGGGGFLVIKMADHSEAVTIDYRECAPKKAIPKRYYQNDITFKKLSRYTPLAVGVPGVVYGLSLSLEKYGSMSWSDVLKPAIKYAKEGIEVSKNLESIIINSYELLSQNDATSKVYLDEGLPLSSGALIKNSDLAESLQLLAQNGALCFYEGQLAEALYQEMKSLGGLITLEDLKGYKAIIKQPVIGYYHDYQIISTSPPSGGGTHLVELLNILEDYNLKELGHNSIQYIHLLAEAMKMVFADKANNMADPAYYNVPVEKLIDKKYAISLRNKINFEKASFNYQAPNWLTKESNNTTHISVVDKDRNLFALTQSINLWFGSGITVESTGILLNNHMADFDAEPGHPNSIEPGKRPVSSIAPTLVLKNGKPFLSIGTPGGSRIISALAQVIINIIDFKMSVDDAIEEPRIHAYKGVLHVEGRINRDVINGLKKLGHKIKIHEDFDNYFGGAQGILIDQQQKKLYGGADSRRDGKAMGY